MKNNDASEAEAMKAQKEDPDLAVGLEPVRRKPEDTVSSLMRRVLVRSGIALVVLGVIAALIGWFRLGGQGAAAAGVAFGLLVIFCLATPAVFTSLSRVKLTFTMLTGYLLVSWLVKILIVIVALVALRSQMWFDHRLFAVFVVAGAVVVLGIEAHAFLTSRLPYIAKR